jgi:hypothetical protein
MQIDIEAIKWIAWGSAGIIIPLKIGLLVRFIRKKIASDEAAQANKK